MYTQGALPYRSLILIPQLIRQPSKGQYCRRYYIICRVESQEISVNSAAGRAPTAIKASMCLDIQLFAVDIILGIMQRKTANVGFKQFD